MLAPSPPFPVMGTYVNIEEFLRSLDPLLAASLVALFTFCIMICIATKEAFRVRNQQRRVQNIITDTINTTALTLNQMPNFDRQNTISTKTVDTIRVLLRSSSYSFTGSVGLQRVVITQNR